LQTSSSVDRASGSGRARKSDYRSGIADVDLRARPRQPETEIGRGRQAIEGQLARSKEPPIVAEVSDAANALANVAWF
jgi:hypothetical protein